MPCSRARTRERARTRTRTGERERRKRMTGRFEEIEYMQHQNSDVATSCFYADVRATVFLSLTAALLLAYAFSPAGSAIMLALSLVFAVCFPVRIGMKMLGSNTLRYGINIPGTGEHLSSMDEGQRKGLQIRIMNGLASALAHNKRVLQQKQTQNKHIMQTSIMLFLYIMSMTVMVMVVGDPLAGLLPPA
ncbi:MAG: hypothetical protein OXU86_07085 [Thaumarchaeota archaeon]|nr:hypothetical protein [Nitrososphaerota archaeon]